MTSLRLVDLRVDHFGPLENLSVTGLTGGLNVIYGPNGSGKTTLLEFLAGVWCGFGDRAWRFLQSGEGKAAGAVTVHVDGGECVIRRRRRAGHGDSLAIQGTGDDLLLLSGVRRALSRLDSERLRLVHNVDSAALHRAHELAALIADSQHSRIGDSEVPGHEANTADALVAAALQEQQQRLTARIAARRRMLQICERRVAETHDRLESDICRLEAEWRRLDGDLQAAVTDLREAEQQARPTEISSDSGDPTWAAARTSRTDHSRRIEALRTVLADLAEDRLRLSLEISRSPLIQRPALDAKRARLDACERENLHQLGILLDQQHQTPRRPHFSPAGRPSMQAAAPSCHTGRLEAQVDYLRHRLDHIRATLTDRWRQRETVLARQRHTAATDTLDRLKYSLAVVEQQLSDLTENRKIRLGADVLVRQYRSSRTEKRLAAASRFFATLTADRYQRFRYDREHEALMCRDRLGSEIPVELFSRGTQEQAALAFRLALLTVPSRHGVSLPAVWDEPLADSDEARLESAAALLADVASHGSQIILFTCRENVAAILERHGAAVHRLDGPADSRIPGDDDGTDSKRSGAAVATNANAPESASAETDVDDGGAAATTETSEPRFRVHPAPRHWLDSVAPISELPSIGPQTARRLQLAGVERIIDLIEFDQQVALETLTEQQLELDQVRLWQAEARLVCSVAGLTGRDAQLLVSCGVLSPKELAQTSADDLIRRIDRLSGDAFSSSQPISSSRLRRATVENWIAAARQPRPLERPARQDDSRSLSLEANQKTAPATRDELRAFRLQPQSPVVDAPSIGEKTARLLGQIGIVTVADLLACDVDQTAARLRLRRVTPKTLTAWQQQARLMCSVPGLRCGDAQILVACGIANPSDLQRISASSLIAIVDPFVRSPAGRRLLRSAKPPTAEDVQRWIETVEVKRTLRAA